jgi:hypothetical protein
LLTPRNGPAPTVLLDGRVLMAGGNDQTGAYLSSAEVYTPGAQQGFTLPDLTYGTPFKVALLDAVGSVPGTFTYAPPDGAILDVGTHTVTVTLTPTDAIDYTTATATASLRVVPAIPSIVISAPTVPYDGSPHGAVATATGVLGEALGPVTITYNGAPTAPSAVGVYSVVASFAGSTDYGPTTATTTLTIVPASARLTLGSLTATYDGTAKAVSVTTAPAGLTGVAVTYNGSATAPTTAGSYAVVAALTNGNYTAPPAAGTLTIGRATPIVSITALSATYDGQPHGALTTVKGVLGEVLAPVVVTYNGALNMPTTAGVYIVLASFAGSTNYQPATATTTLVIAQASLVITANNATKIVGAQNPAFTAQMAGFVGTDGVNNLAGTLTLSTPATAASGVGSYSITPGGVTSVNYAITFVSGRLTITYGIAVKFDQTKAVKSGATLPIEIELVNVRGADVSARAVVVTALTVALLSSPTTAVTIDDNFRFDPTMGRTGGYVFNLKTKGLSAGTYVLAIGVSGDPVTHTVMFQVK